MTNVPDKIRSMWTDVYKLFDISYPMENTAEAWSTYWGMAREILEKYDDDKHLMDMLTVCAEMIAERFKERGKPDEKTLLWHPDEDYPYPKK